MLQLFVMALAVVAITRTARGRGTSALLWGAVALAGWLVLTLWLPRLVGQLLAQRGMLRGGTLMVAEFAVVAAPFLWLGLVYLWVRLVPGRSHAQPPGQWACPECGWLNTSGVFKCEACQQEYREGGSSGRTVASLIPILVTALGTAVSAQTPDLEQAGSVRLLLEGWCEQDARDEMRLWRDSDGDVLSLAVLDETFVLADTEADLRHYARQLAARRGGGLIEATIAPAPRVAASWVYKRLQHPAYVYTGMLVMQGAKTPIIWTVVAAEHGVTGTREAVITAEMMKAGQLTLESYQQSWVDPYDPSFHGVDRSVLRFISDDKRYDERFPQHPLSKVRRVLAALPTSVTGVP